MNSRDRLGQKPDRSRLRLRLPTDLLTTRVQYFRKEVMAYLSQRIIQIMDCRLGTTADWITAATALINSYCRRPDLNVIQYTERLRADQRIADGAAELSCRWRLWGRRLLRW